MPDPRTAIHHGIDRDFAGEVLADLYRYRRKRRGVAWALWLVFGWLGAHRFYMERYGTALLMMFTGGGLLVWWAIDGFAVTRMVGRHNTEQEQRQKAGLPPLELDFMPALTGNVLERPPAWTARWNARGRLRRTLRVTGDVLVLIIAGFALGPVAAATGSNEAFVAVIVLTGLAVAGDSARWMNRFPVARDLVRWDHRLRLFYYYNEPKSPPALLLRSFSAAVTAPFRRRTRAEVGLYLQLGGAFTLLFLLEDLAFDVVGPALAGQAMGLTQIAGVFLEEAVVNFVVIYAFASPIGAVLTLYILTRPTHTVPRVLAAVTLVCVAAGAAFAG